MCHQGMVGVAEGAILEKGDLVTVEGKSATESASQKSDRIDWTLLQLVQEL